MEPKYARAYALLWGHLLLGPSCQVRLTQKYSLPPHPLREQSTCLPAQLGWGLSVRLALCNGINGRGRNPPVPPRPVRIGSSALVRQSVGVLCGPAAATPAGLRAVLVLRAAPALQGGSGCIDPDDLSSGCGLHVDLGGNRKISPSISPPRVQVRPRRERASCSCRT